MHPLLLLYTLQGKAFYRRLTRNLKSIKGALLFIVGVLVVGLWLGPSLWQAVRAQRTDPAQVRDAAPVILLAMCFLALVSSGGEKAIAFTPAEVDFLFPGPFTRRQLLAYKIGKSLAGVAFSSLLLSIVFLQHAAAWPAAFAGLFLALLLVQLFGMAITLIAQSAGERAYTRTRKIILVLIIAAVAIAVLPAFKNSQRPGFFEIARQLRASRAGSILLAPLDVFGRLFTAASFAQALLYAALAIFINLVLLFVVFYLDADYLEAAAAKSQVVYERLQRVRKGGLSAFTRPGKKARGALPTFPHLAGVGPIAWRQATAALRNSKGLLFILLILAISVGPIVFAEQKADKLGPGVIAVMAWITLIVGGWLRFDFRGDLDQMDHLKSLPVSATALSAGQLLTPTLLMTLCHLIIVTTVLAAARRIDPILLYAAAVSLPFNALLFGIENVMFLLFPTRAAATPADFQGYGRQILLLFAKGAVLLTAAGISALAGLLVHRLTHSRPAAIATATLVLSAFALAVIPAVAWSFKRFDVSADIPG
jgi:hypothetical protein